LNENIALYSVKYGINTLKTESESYVTTDGQSASLSWNKAPIWGLRPDFYCCQTIARLLMWGAVSDERTGLSFTVTVGLRQRSHFRVRVPKDSSYFTVSDLRLPFSSPHTTRRVTVEGFDPTSQETHYVSATEPNRLMLLEKQSLFILRTIRNT
jgi:hypothetical protein